VGASRAGEVEAVLGAHGLKLASDVDAEEELPIPPLLQSTSVVQDGRPRPPRRGRGRLAPSR
jgi:hypothetical protein